MGIDLSLRLTPHAAPRPRDLAEPRDPADSLVAWARGFVPVAWWLLFAPGDAVMGPYGLALITRSDAALDRLRRRGPEIRAAAGRHALGLRSIEAALQGAPSMFLRAELHELYEVMPKDLPALSDPARLDVWPSSLDRGRILASKHHGGTLADAVVGAVPKQAVELPDLATLEARSLAALRAGDSSELDLLEEALARQLAEALAPWLSMTRRRWGEGRADAAADEVLTALAEGRPEPFAPLARTHKHFAAHALRGAAGRAHDRRTALRRALRGATEPLAAPIALALRVACPSLDALYVAEWLDGGPPPRRVASLEAVLACRLAAIGAPAWQLSPHDPIAVVERALHAKLAVTPVAPADAPDLAVSRALGLSAEAARSWLRDGESDDPLAIAAREVTQSWLREGESDEALAIAARRVAEALCTSAIRIDGPTRAALRDLPAPEVPFLAGTDRACIRLALGDLEALPILLADDTASTTAVVAALRSASASDRALGWLAERARSGDLGAATLILDTPGADETALAAARSAAASALHDLAKIRTHYDDGLITTSEFDARLAEIAALARALGPDGMPLREALGD
ncbi:hypothetical protein OV090_36055 [Nannocystis sp. RBIL2]|uniref:hypothetical protein n=1 Tax=Nannocystis sp. RBIL2 TaxID=2996788 RepID=UPI0022707A46|nr:hypothetical protein [Nannocystis sp. RBIL2]MCY1070214.1 hypothetical protein [Nannocystis sp. RBIL2]